MRDGRTAAAAAGAGERGPEGKDIADEFCSQVLTEEFWTRLAAQRPLQLPGAAAGLPERFAAAGPLDAFVQGSIAGALCAEKRGQPYERENLFVAYLDQATLSLEGAERYCPLLMDLCQGLALSFDYATSRLVLDPPACSGHPVAVDADTLLVQLWGEQRLTVFKPFEAGAAMLRPEALLDSRLRPGDALLVPNGLGCRLVGSGAPLQPRGASAPRGGGACSSRPGSASARGPSLCALLRVRLEQQSFEFSVREFFTEALRAAPLSGDADGFFRSAATKHSLPDRYSGATEAPGAAPPKEVAARLRAELEARLRRCAEELAPKLTATGLAENYAARMDKLRQAQQRGAAEAAKAAAGPPEPLAVPGATVRVAWGVACRCTGGSAMASFTRGDATLNLPIQESASYMISRLSDGRAHAVESLPCDDPIERICVCNVLIFKECLELVAGGGQTPP